MEKLSRPRTYKRRYGRMVLIIMLVRAVHARSYLRNLQWLFLITWRFMTKIIRLIFASRRSKHLSWTTLLWRQSDFPVAVRELVVGFRVTLKDINDRADRQYVEEQVWEAAWEKVEPMLFDFSPTREDGVDVCSDPDARAKFKLSPTMEDGVEVCSDPVVRSVHKSDYMSDPGRKPEGQEGCSGGTDYNASSI